LPENRQILVSELCSTPDVREQRTELDPALGPDRIFQDRPYLGFGASAVGRCAYAQGTVYLIGHASYSEYRHSDSVIEIGYLQAVQSFYKNDCTSPIRRSGDAITVAYGELCFLMN